MLNPLVNPISEIKLPMAKKKKEDALTQSDIVLIKNSTDHQFINYRRATGFNESYFDSQSFKFNLAFETVAHALE